jgi:hypothetical protein
VPGSPLCHRAALRVVAQQTGMSASSTDLGAGCNAQPGQVCRGREGRGGAPVDAQLHHQLRRFERLMR